EASPAAAAVAGLSGAPQREHDLATGDIDAEPAAIMNYHRVADTATGDSGGFRLPRARPLSPGSDDRHHPVQDPREAE
ncbi:MAG: hypothetical protein ACRDZ5_10765, partial [Acidimicrobiales bacterium]